MMKGILMASAEVYIFPGKSHESEQVLDPDYTPTNAEKHLFEARQIFMFSVFDKKLLTDMGKTIVRKYVHMIDAQSVYKDFQEHMISSSKGASEKRRLTQYVTTTILDEEVVVTSTISCGSQCQGPCGPGLHGIVMLVMHLYILSKLILAVLIVTNSQPVTMVCGLNV